MKLKRYNDTGISPTTAQAEIVKAVVRQQDHPQQMPTPRLPRFARIVTKRSWLILLLLLLTTNCRTAEELQPTPFIQLSPTSDPANTAPITVTIADLAASPAFFEGATLRLTGQYKRLPKLVCPGEKFDSPASWGVVANGLLAQAGGFDSQLRSLIPDDLTMTVEGQWQRWQGPVGCGKKAVEQDIWYLAVTEIVAPSPLALVTLTPGAAASPTEPVAIAELEGTETPTAVPDLSEPPPTDENSPPEDEEPLPVDEELPPPADEEPPPGDEEQPPTDEETPPSDEASLTPTPTDDTGSGDLPTSTPAGTATTAVNLTPTPTPGAGTPTATPDSNQEGTIVDQDLLSAEDLGAARLGVSEIHQWLYDVSASEAITVSVVSADADLIISILDPNEQQLIEANNFAAGQVETIQNFALSTLGEYKIRVRSSGRSATDYAIMITSSESYTFIFRGVMEYGDLQEATSKANNDHFWHFRGQEGDVITINLNPMDDSDPFLELYGPDAERISESIDDGTNGEGESLVDFELPATGLYSIRVGEWEFLPMTYELELLGNDLSQRLLVQAVM